jgi:PAS domain S-box-containing protein
MGKETTSINSILDILILEDSMPDKELVIEQLTEAGYQLTVTHSEDENTFTEALKRRRYDIIISDFKLPGFDAFGALEQCQKICPEVPFICVSGSIGEEKAIELLKRGAVDYVLKDRPDRLPHAVLHALEKVKEKEARLNAERELMESEARFRQVAETAQEWIWEVDTKGLYTYSSPMIETLLGYTPGEVVGKKHFYDFFVPEEKERLKNAALKVFEIEEIFRNFENINIRKDGQRVILSTSGSPVFDSSGKLTGYRGVDEDVTGRKASEAEQQRLLRQVERDRMALLSALEDQQRAETQLRKLSQAVEQSPASVIITNTDGIIEYVNPKFTEITGYTPEESIGQTPRILKSDRQSPEFYKVLWETISSDKEWKGELQNKKKNGELYWESALISPIKNEQGEIINYLAVKEDVTELKQAEANFRHSLDQSPLGIRIVTREGKTIYVNPAFLDIYDFTSLDEYIIMPAYERYSEKSYQEHLLRKESRKAGKDVTDYEISIRQKYGGIRYVKVSRKEVIWNREKHFQVINQDITEQKNLFNDLVLAKEKAEESDRLKSAFLANLSHEIRTPMNGILGFLGLLKEPDLSEETKADYIDIVNKSGRRLMNTINDIVEISKIDARQVKVKKTRFCVVRLLKDLADFFKPEAMAKGVKLQTQMPEHALEIESDKGKFESICTNLIKNAIKFTHYGEINVVLEHTGGKLIIAVSDTGIGIVAENLDKIFERFVQSETDLSRIYEGTGLGLSITREYIKLLNGNIRVQSEVNKGTTFYVEFPESELNISAPKIITSYNS